MDGLVALARGSVGPAMTGTVFYKMTGSGNDFLLFDGRTTSVEAWPAERILQICDRRQGVGADGIVFLEPAGERAVRMKYFNSDGSPAELCGNAALCSTRLAAYLELAPPEGMDLETDAGRLRSRCVGPSWAAELLLPEVSIPKPIELPLRAGELRAFYGRVGVPHVVLLVQDVAGVDVDGRGREIRFAEAFGPAGTNVNFVSKLRTDDGDGADWALRTYERGVEGETLACGTGTVAVAVAVARAGLGGLPTRIRAGSGATFSVAGVLTDQRAMDVWLCGEGRLLFTGVLK